MTPDEIIADFLATHSFDVLPDWRQMPELGEEDERRDAEFNPDQPRDEQGQWTESGSGVEGRPVVGHVARSGLERRFPEANATVDGRKFRTGVPNESSIDSSLTDYVVLDGIREVQLSEFLDQGPQKFYSTTEEQRTQKLADAIRESSEISPLIVVVDEDERGPYILEGGHRFDALRLIGAKSFPARVVVDTSSLKIAAAARVNGETALHAVADSFIPRLALSFRHAFAQARRTARRTDDIETVIATIATALEATLPRALTAVLRAGGDVALEMLPQKRDAEFDPNQPRDDHGRWVGFHGSTADVVDKILKEGIIPSGRFDNIRGDKLAYATASFESAETYAVVRARETGKIPVIFELQIPKSTVEEFARTYGKGWGFIVSEGFKAEWIKAVFSPDPKGKFQRRDLSASENSETTYAVVLIDPEARAAAAKLKFSVANKKTTAWAKKHAGELISDVTETSRKRIRSAIAGLTEGKSWNDALDVILDAVGDDDRAELIARNEVMTAVHEGQRQAWEQAIEHGLLDEDARRTWIVVGDEKVCPICSDLDGEISDLDGEYRGGVVGPPAHPLCRCTEGIV